MKFENDFIRVIVEKKQLTEEQKELHRQKRKKRLPYAVTVLVLAAAILEGTLYSHFHVPNEESLQQAAANMEGGGAKEQESPAEEEEFGNEQEQAEGTYIPATMLATSVQEKYKDKGLYDYTYGDPIDDLGRSEAIEISLGFDPAELGVEYWYDICGFYQDADLTQRIIPNYAWDEETEVLSMTPPNYSVNLIATTLVDAETVNRYDHSQYRFFDKGDGFDWGNLGTFYMAVYYDRETGERLDKPEVSIVNRAGELKETPNVSYTVLEDGRPQFRWTPVEGAGEYMICKTAYDPEDGYDTTMYVLGVTSDTTWTTEAPEYGSFSIVNSEFKTFQISEDDWKNELSYESYKEDYEPGQAVKRTEALGEPGLCVIAVCEEGTSMASNVIFFDEMAPNLPNATASNTQNENNFSTQQESVEELPSYDYVVMCDGVVNRKVIDYQTEKATVSQQRFINVDDNGEYIDGENIACLEIPYIVSGTPFSFSMRVLYYDETNLEKDLKFIEDREEKLRRKSGEISPEAQSEAEAADREDTQSAEETESQVRQVTDSEIFANSALTEYLALNMLGGATYIDVSAFPEAKDTAFLEDAMLEAYYQNPLILGLSSYIINRKGTALRITYDETMQSQANKQEEIKQKINEIIPRIITEDMTEQEKEFAINEYLCSTIEYDDDALADAEKNDFMYVDESFNDSFTAYGALINGKCVCAGYAAAFKLLAEAAGLEAIVVNGMLDGSLSHAWNKVKIGEEWQIVDVTNNDNEYIYNALLNLPSSVGDRVLVEGREFMLDKMIPEYVGETDENEYYHITDSYFPAKEMAQKLSEELMENGSAVLRTDYDLNDDDFYEITNEIYRIMGDDTDLYGYYWLGVIYLSAEGD